MGIAATKILQDALAMLRLKTPSLARERAVFRLAKLVPSDAEGTEAGDIGFIVDTAPGVPGQPGGRQAARSQIEFSDGAWYQKQQDSDCAMDCKPLSGEQGHEKLKKKFPQVCNVMFLAVLLWHDCSLLRTALYRPRAPFACGELPSPYLAIVNSYSILKSRRVELSMRFLRARCVCAGSLHSEEQG